MKKLTQKGFSAVEVVLVLAVVGIIGGVGWYVMDQNKKDETKTPATTQKETVPAYKKTTTPGANWKTYSNTKNKLSFQHPADWKIEDRDDELGFNVDLTPPGTPVALYGFYTSGDSTLAKTAKAFRDSVKTDDIEPMVLTTIENEKKYTFDGHNAIQFDYSQKIKGAATSYTTDVYIEANNKIYKFTTGSQEEYQLKAGNDILAVFESLKLQ